ncbi:MAG: hypothetical protein U9Q69_06315 [Nanoarchaeota archaeon]|nr:hypothetical protein [Nanoarchaeota archaeon]
MAKDIDPQKVKKELIKVFEEFVKDPNDKNNLERIHQLWDKYDSSAGYSFFDESTGKAINFLVYMLQAGKHDYFTEERVLNKVKKILENLKS